MRLKQQQPAHGKNREIAPNPEAVQKIFPVLRLPSDMGPSQIMLREDHFMGPAGGHDLNRWRKGRDDGSQFPRYILIFGLPGDELVRDPFLEGRVKLISGSPNIRIYRGNWD